ncbi:hypothetical protein ACEQ8H_000650 [Pleosporales sp. CAS-2024a]
MFPKRHAFEYSYLQCGFPITPAGTRADGTEVGGGVDVKLGRWWMRIRAEDYLTRGLGDIGFYEKLKLYLREQKVEDAEWSYAYLVTAPRFFGYAFNPVSFWYVYDSEHHLKKMVLEVNNTFGERRIYLLDGSNVLPSAPQSTDSETSGLDSPLGVKSRFGDMWMKDFHVSPFNSRKGSYVLRAQNPFPYASYDTPVIDNTITLISTKDHAKLVARLYSDGPALDQSQMSNFDMTRFVLTWWWVGLVTFPRIIKEAGMLFFRRKLHVWFRPEVLQTSIGRSSTLDEIELFEIFENYLGRLVDSSQVAFSIKLHTAIPGKPIREIATWHTPGRNPRTHQLEIRVLTPAFYSRFIHYAHTSEAFDRECIFTDEKNRTVWVSRPELIPQLLNSTIPIEEFSPRLPRSQLGELRWAILRRLRCAPATPAYPVSVPTQTEFTATEDIRSLPFSDLDRYMRIVFNRHKAERYRRIVTSYFLAERFAFGFTELVGLMDLVVRVLLCWLGAYHLTALSAQDPETGIFGCSTSMLKDETVYGCFQGVKAAYGEWWWLIGTMVATSACHGYGLIKGYD